MAGRDEREADEMVWVDDDVAALDGGDDDRTTRKSPPAASAPSGKGGKGRKDLVDLGWPEESGRAHPLVLTFRRWTFSYMDRVLRRGARQVLADGTHLTQDDLYRVPVSMESTFLDDEFNATYSQNGGRLLRTLWHLAAPTFVPAGFCQLVTVVAQVSIPLLVRQLLIILEESAPSRNVTSEGSLYAALIFLATVVNAFGTHRMRHLALKSGVTIRAAMVSAIYGRALRLTPKGRAGLTTGEVTNLVAIDTQKLFEVMQEGHLIWSCPLTMILVAIALILIMGWTAVVGMLILFAFVPLTERIIRRMLLIRKERIRETDARSDVVNAMLQGIRVTKLNNYEERYLLRANETRERELHFLTREFRVWAMTLALTVITPVIASAAAFVTYVLVDEANVLTASMTFTVLLLFSALRFPINYSGRLIGRAAQAIESARRISDFLSRDARPPRCVDDGGVPVLAGSSGAVRAAENGASEDSSFLGNERALPLSTADDAPILSVSRGTFRVGSFAAAASWDDVVSGVSDHGFTLSGVDFELSRRQILAIVGPVGSGKTTLTNALVGEVAACPETAIVANGKVAYASQTPFILNTTLRENILFGSTYNQDRYEKVLDACCLRQDIEQLGGAGDLTEIGERGVTLSGGQKQRVSLARVVYSKPDIAIFDDPLSALDAGTSRRVFERLFRSPDEDLLASSAVVLVTHAAHFLHNVDNIMVLVEGRKAFAGSWEELCSFESDDELTEAAVDALRSAVQEKAAEEYGGGSVNSSKKVDKDPAKSGNTKSEGGLMSMEEREHGLSSYKTWLVWFRHAGGVPFVLSLAVLLGGDRFAYVATEWWLARWTQAHDGPIQVFGLEFPSQTEGRSAQYEYLKVYALLLLATFSLAVMRSLWAVAGGVKSARSLFALMIARVVRAPMSFFETTPLGRILNRFTYDVEILDQTLTQNMSILMIASSWFVAGVCVMCVIIPWIIFALIPITVMYLLLQLHYRKSGADLQRLDAVSRSPIQAMLAEGLDGATTIRVFQQEENFLSKFQRSADINTSAQLNFITAQRWLGVRIELLGACIVLVATLLVVLMNEKLLLDAGLVAMLIIWSSNFTITLGFLVDYMSESEAAITSIERIRTMSLLPQEECMETPESFKVGEEWPRQGLLEFDDVCMRYRDGLPLALNGLSFEVEPGARCGVVGRTGAGKSSLTAALFRLVEAESGKILLDGVDLSTLGLSDVRGRPNGMSIIPQDPVLFAGTLRECLDPFGGSSDEDMVDALLSVRLPGAERGLSVLNDPVEEGGTNFSVGERQLLCLARAILAKPKLLVLDEATASVDGETDAFIQQMLRTRFRDTTLLTVAHRLNTIMDYDVILVMANGKAVEFGPPQALLELEAGVFTELVEATGEESATALKAMAKEAYRGC